ncbi:MAM and LDL-receptor class A domain-containing protein 1-like [Pecten maximus]|uniref:MAM and LDL-receptor class A domain-containing protein 1-like n=1 Tax=Pecten maximus TaxID=6579 RepID=UPI0014582637|nr:MAM and LDL-receptor class A domain-containing protein 1-like [Pecten maximus]
MPSARSLVLLTITSLYMAMLAMDIRETSLLMTLELLLEPALLVEVVGLNLDSVDGLSWLTDEFDWSIGSNGTASRGTGPAFDHTYGSNSGHFAYIESSAPQRQNDRAIIKSPLYSGSNNRCLRFWYHMYGQSIGSLNVYTQINGSFPRQIWTRNGNQGNMWRRGTVTLPANHHSYSILIEGVRGSSYTGDIAVDDLYISDGSCPTTGFCNFEQDTCGWTNAVTVDDFDWLRDRGGTTSKATGPSVDHTTGSSSGYYMYIETSQRGLHRKTAWLVSDILTPTTGSCLRFWYHMYGSGIGSLNIYTQNTGASTKTLKWTLSNNQGNVWKQATVSVPAMQQEFNIIFEGVYNGSYLGDIAIDDVAYVGSPCSVQPSTSPSAITVSPSPSTYPSTPLDCNFEHGICNWQQDQSDSFDWSLHRGSTSSSNTGPTTDHTLRNVNGQYAYIEVSGKHNNDKARLISPILNIGSQGMCLKFWYNMYGANVNHLNIYTNSSGTASLVWTRFGDQGMDWKYAQVHIENTGRSVLEFEGVAGPRYAGDIALDDITVNTGNCPQDGTCDFENGLCGYVQSVSDVFDWTLNSGRTSSAATGPPTDHTFGTNEGHYMYIESSRPRRPGDKARLNTPQFSKTSASCFQFWYSMNGRTTGRLNVYQRAVSTANLGQPIWKRSGPQGPRWYLGQVTIRSQTDFFLTFEGVVGSSFYSDIAIDDITMTTGYCPPPGDCDFESGFCTWYNNQVNDTFDWQRNKGPSTSTGTGPMVDHTLNSRYGTYIYIEASSPRHSGDNAYLMSQMFGPQQRCIQFYYNMYGATMGSLNLWMWQNGGQTSHNLWTMMGNQGNAWKQVQIQIPAASSSYRLVFEGVIGNGVTSDMAIDDIIVVQDYAPRYHPQLQ